MEMVNDAFPFLLLYLAESRLLEREIMEEQISVLEPVVDWNRLGMVGD
jgi:hypothetical protein